MISTSDELTTALGEISADDHRGPGSAAPITDELRRVVVGRSPDCDLVRSNTAVSRRHIELLVGVTTAARDLGSSNGSVIVRGGERIVMMPHDWHQLHRGDLVLTRGGEELFQVDSEPSS